MKKAQILGSLLNVLPKSTGDKLCRKVIDGYIDKYAEIDVLGLENIKNVKPPIVFVCNHLSNSDGLILGRVLKKFSPTFVAGVKLSGDNATSIGVRVTKSINIKPNTADKDALSKLIKILRNGENVVIFPEGTRSRTGSMIEGKKGVIFITRMSKAVIIPIGMTGTEKLLPINKEGHMGDENFHHAKVHVNIGKSITLDERKKDEDRHEYDQRELERVMRNIASLISEEYRGVYR